MTAVMVTAESKALPAHGSVSATSRAALPAGCVCAHACVCARRPALISTAAAARKSRTAPRAAHHKAGDGLKRAALQEARLGRNHGSEHAGLWCMRPVVAVAARAGRQQVHGTGLLTNITRCRPLLRGVGWGAKGSGTGWGSQGHTQVLPTMVSLCTHTPGTASPAKAGELCQAVVGQEAPAAYLATAQQLGATCMVVLGIVCITIPISRLCCSRLCVSCSSS